MRDTEKQLEESQKIRNSILGEFHKKQIDPATGIQALAEALVLVYAQRHTEEEFLSFWELIRDTFPDVKKEMMSLNDTNS